ncbi:high mobility group protein 20A-like [Tubulanus polymorphus]|uniref:high mobility group protein 20A-like n=1 Tax=Tubulanus polymorphus TaxID=672921 RepID=UPI003DA3CDAC
MEEGSSGLTMSNYPTYESIDDDVSKGSTDLTVVDTPSQFSTGEGAGSFTAVGTDSNSVNPDQFINVSNIDTVSLMSSSDPMLQTVTTVSAVTANNTAATQSKEMEIQKKTAAIQKKKRNRKRKKDVNAPRQPLSGYLRFLNSRREIVRTQTPTLTFSEITRLLANEWTNLAPDEKQKHLDAAEKDKERYTREMEAYHKTEAYRVFQLKKQEAKQKEMEAELNQNQIISPLEFLQHDNVTSKEDGDNGDEDAIGTFDIPIFTEEFLDHNKNRESELRQLRRQNTEYEEQNAILTKHIENMKQAIEKLETESNHQKTQNLSFRQHLHSLRSTLTTNFSAVPIPGCNELPRMDTIDTYLAKLHSLILDSPHENETLISTVREIVGRMNLDTI